MDSKAWWASKGVWGGIVSLIASVLLAIWGVEISPDDQDLIVNLAIASASAFGGVMAIVGRVRAKKQIGGKDNAA